MKIGQVAVTAVAAEAVAVVVAVTAAAVEDVAVVVADTAAVAVAAAAVAAAAALVAVVVASAVTKLNTQDSKRGLVFQAALFLSCTGLCDGI